MGQILNEAKKYYDLGFGIHWLSPNSKRPVKPGWNLPERDNWETLIKEYKEGFGLGLRLGFPSRLKCGEYLAVIDVDIKGGLEKYESEVINTLDNHFQNLWANAPMVRTGLGYHIYLRTSRPFKSHEIATSEETVKVYMPDEPINDKQRALVDQRILTTAELESGFRGRPAWQIELMSEGKQVVLPPTLHPITKKPYEWVKGNPL